MVGYNAALNHITTGDLSRSIWRVIAAHPVLAMVALFGFYQLQYGDFFAYFHSGDNIHLTGAPFSSIWPSDLGTNWLEATL